MHPEKTNYYLATSPADYRKCHALSKDTLSFPTVMAVRDDKIIGFLSTRPDKKRLVAGPLVAPNFIVAMRLIEAYEVVLKKAGVSLYLFYVAEDAPTSWRSALMGAGETVRPIGKEGQLKWFERRI